MSQIAQMSPDEIAERFYVSGRGEITQILNELINHRENVSIYFNNGRGSFLSRLLAVWPRYNWLLLDWSGSRELNADFMHSEGSVIVASQSGIKIQFPAGRATLTTYGDDGEMAFAVPIPTRIVRLQRRDYFRITPSRVSPLVATWTFDDEERAVTIHDLSVAGTGIVLDEMPSGMGVGDPVGTLRFTLPDETEIRTDIEFRHLTPHVSRYGFRQHVLGASFNAISPAEERHIQRYIIQVEHERHELVGH